MRCTGVTLTNYRNIERAAVTFDAGVTVLWGENAQGKTNLLEAIVHAAIGRSFRAAREAEVLRFGCETGGLSLDYEAEGRAQNITIRLSRSHPRAIEKNGVRIPRISELVGSFRAVLFCPEHLSLVKDGPAERRRFLDLAISTLRPTYLASLQRYDRALRQRNALLRAAAEDRRIFDETGPVWSAQLAAEGARIMQARQEYAAQLNEVFARCVYEMTEGAEHAEAIYRGCLGKVDMTDAAALEEQLLRQLTANTTREIAAGTTLYGVQKDDLELLLGGVAARGYASQGQQRSLALALKIAEAELCRRDCGEEPVLLLDDVLSELDARRRGYLLQSLAAGRQVILTTCEPLTAIPGHVRRIHVKEGTYEEG